MKAEWVILVSVGLFLIPAVISLSQNIETQQIDEVRNKGVLDSKDLQIIDDFLAEAVQALVRTRDFTSVAKTRTVILSKRSPQGQYAKQFSESAYKHISSALEQARDLPEERRFKVVLNLLILIDGLADPRLTDLALGMLNHDSKVIRYWAVRCVTNPGLLENVNPNGIADSQLIQRILQQLKNLIDSCSAEELTLIAQFAAKVQTPQGEDLLKQIADMRIKKYADWTVEYELLDGILLKLLYNKMTSTAPGTSLTTVSISKPEMAQRFAQLYSYAMQRYIEGKDSLTDSSKSYLASVLVEIEDKCIGRLLLRPQSTIMKAIEGAAYSALAREHDRLFGDQTQPGELVTKLKIDFGKNENGSRRTTPLRLPEPHRTTSQ
jgi:hypothetical protein